MVNCTWVCHITNRVALTIGLPDHTKLKHGPIVPVPGVHHANPLIDDLVEYLTGVAGHPGGLRYDQVVVGHEEAVEVGDGALPGGWQLGHNFQAQPGVLSLSFCFRRGNLEHHILVLQWKVMCLYRYLLFVKGVCPICTLYKEVGS